MRLLSLLVAALLAAACARSPQPTTASAQGDAGAASTSTPATTPMPRPAASAAGAAASAEGEATGPRIDQECATESMSLQQVDGTRSALLLRRAGTYHRIATPPEMVAYMPVAIDCVYSPRDGGAYFVVDFGTPRGTCAECHWPYLLDLAGRPLYRIDPLWAPGGDGSARRANTGAYAAMLASEQLGKPELTPLRWR